MVFRACDGGSHVGRTTAMVAVAGDEDACVCVCFNACMDALWVFVCVRGAGARVDGSRDAVERRG